MGNTYLRLSLTNEIKIIFIAQFFTRRAKHDIHDFRNKNILRITLYPASLKTRGCTRVVQLLLVLSKEEA